MPYLTIMMALASVLGTVAPLVASGAQESTDRATATVALVATPNLPRGAKVIVERRPALNPRDVILVDLDRATAADLAAAVQTLASLDRRTGDDAKATLRAAPRSFSPTPGFDNSHFGRQMKAGLARLLTAPEVNVAGIGRARSVQIRVNLSASRNGGARS